MSFAFGVDYVKPLDQIKSTGQCISTVTFDLGIVLIFILNSLLQLDQYQYQELTAITCCSDRE